MVDVRSNSQPASVLSSASNLVFLDSRVPNHSTTLVISLSPARPVTSRMCVTSFECKWIMRDCVFSHWPTKENTPRIICCLSLKVKKHFYPIISSVCTFWKLHSFQFTFTDDNENSTAVKHYTCLYCCWSPHGNQPRAWVEDDIMSKFRPGDSC